MKRINTLNNLIEGLTGILNIPEGKRLVAVFGDNNSNTVLGFCIIGENETPKDATLYSVEELYDKYKKQ